MKQMLHLCRLKKLLSCNTYWNNKEWKYHI